MTYLANARKIALSSSTVKLCAGPLLPLACWKRGAYPSSGSLPAAGEGEAVGALLERALGGLLSMKPGPSSPSSNLHTVTGHS